MSVLVLGRARARLAEAPTLTILLASLVAAAMLLAPTYLIVRVAGEGSKAWDIISASNTTDAVIRTAMLALAVTGASIAISVPLAWLTTRTDLPLKQLWTVLLVLPLVVPSYVGAFILVSALGPRGTLQDWLSPFGVERLPEVYGFSGAWLALTIFSYPYVFLPLRAAFQGLDPALEEAARGLGKSGIETFRRVILPQLRPAMMGGGLLIALYTLSDFGAVSILRFDSLTRIVYLQYTTAFDRSAAAALGLVLVMMALMLVLIEGVTRGAGRYYSQSQRRQPATVRLGHWRWPALLLCLLVVGIGVAMPVSVVTFWLVRGLQAGESIGFVQEAAFNSAYASGLAALVAVAAALPVVYLAVRHPSPASSLLEKATYAGFALPAITVALALVFFASNYAPTVYQTLGLLVFAYVVRFLPQAISACRSSLVQINPRTEEAARSLGHGPSRVFLRITAPQMLPGLSAGAVMVFLTAMKELPATLLLSPIGFHTLATEIWASTSEAFFARAALPALVLLALSGVPTALMVLREPAAHE
ncbi:MAG TPA: iron ABC transporter permease [Dehalococcoidia bacterium]|nr:iron ABC transporter permease [Dehalococcoidia bacterium]